MQGHVYRSRTDLSGLSVKILTNHAVMAGLPCWNNSDFDPTSGQKTSHALRAIKVRMAVEAVEVRKGNVLGCECDINPRARSLSASHKFHFIWLKRARGYHDQIFHRATTSAKVV
jgi:hypothetical protein